MGRQSSVMISYRNNQKAAHSSEKKMEQGITKGAWSREEDRKLTAYIGRYGIWNWNHMPKPAGLARSGKSCRLRWMNYLKPGVRHGNFTKQEEDTIIKWHQLLGNKWSTIASKLEGRTDNEIKNYWHTRIKKRVTKAVIHKPIMQHNKVADSSIIISQDQESITQVVDNNEAASDHNNTSSNSESEELGSTLLDYTLMQDEFWGAEDDQNSVTDNNNNTSPCTDDTESVWSLDYYSPPLIDHYSLLPNEFSAINEKLVAEDVLFESSSSGIAAELHHNIWEQLPHLLPSLDDMLMKVDFGVPFIDYDTSTSPYSSQESLANDQFPFYDLWGSI